MIVKMLYIFQDFNNKFSFFKHFSIYANTNKEPAGEIQYTEYYSCPYISPWCKMVLEIFF